MACMTRRLAHSGAPLKSVGGLSSRSQAAANATLIIGEGKGIIEDIAGSKTMLVHS